MSQPSSPSFTRYIFSLLALCALIQSINWDIVEIITFWLRSIWSSLAVTELCCGKLLPNRSERKLQRYLDSGVDWYRGRNCWTSCWTGWWLAAASGILACSTRGRLAFLLLFVCCPFSFSLSQLLLRRLYKLTQNTEVIFLYRWHRVSLLKAENTLLVHGMEQTARASLCACYKVPCISHQINIKCMKCFSSSLYRRNVKTLFDFCCLNLGQRNLDYE